MGDGGGGGGETFSVSCFLNVRSTCEARPRGGSGKTIVCAATLRQKSQSKLAISPSHNVPKLGQSVLALTLQHLASARQATGVPNLCH